MKLLVTGASGFIGGHLVSRLRANGHEVVGVDISRKCPPLSALADLSLRCDIREARAMDDLLAYMHFDACVHLAAIASPNRCKDEPELAWSTNLHGTYNVLSLCQTLGVKRFIFLSSAHVYGISPKYMPTDEEHPLSLLDIYTATKIAGENLVEQFYKNHRMSYVTLRLFNAYGRDQSDLYFMGAKLKEARNGGPVIMRAPLADITKDWVHVSDVVEAIALALKSDYVGPLNVGTGVETRLIEIARAIADGFGVPLESRDEGDPGPTRMCADYSRIRDTLGWSPSVAISDGVRELVEQART